MGCSYCGKRLIQPTVKHQNKNFHFECYLKKDESKIFSRSELDDIVQSLDVMSRRLDFMTQTCDIALDDKSSLEARQKKFQEICATYADLVTKKYQPKSCLSLNFIGGCVMNKGIN